MAKHPRRRNGKRMKPGKRPAILRSRSQSNMLRTESARSPKHGGNGLTIDGKVPGSPREVHDIFFRWAVGSGDRRGLLDSCARSDPAFLFGLQFTDIAARRPKLFPGALFGDLVISQNNDLVSKWQMLRLVGSATELQIGRTNRLTRTYLRV